MRGENRSQNIPEVVRDDNDTTGEFVDGVSERVNGGDIETVGRLVEQEHVGTVDGEESEGGRGRYTDDLRAEWEDSFKDF